MPSSLHDVLIERQTDAELERKARKAKTRGLWTQEDIDWTRRRAQRLSDAIKWE